MKRSLFPASLLCCLAAVKLAAADPLAEHLWRERVLLVATPSLADERYQQQAAQLLPSLAELAGEHIAIVVAQPGDPARQRVPLKDDDFLVALIGLDGGMKLARREPIAAEVLRREVAAVSLRRSELKSAERARLKGDTAAGAAADALKQKLAPETPPAKSPAH